MDTNGYKKKIFVTGASGFIGQRLVSKLLRTGYVVLALENKSKINKRHKNLTVIRGSLDSLTFNNVANVDCVVHLAAYMGNLKDSDDSQYMKINFESTVNIFNICKKNKIRFIYCSSTVAKDKQNYKDWYAKSKFMASKYICKSIYKKWVIVYPTAVIDVEKIYKGNIAGFLMARVGQKNRTINIVSVDNIADAIVKIIGKHDILGEYNLGGVNIDVDKYLRISHRMANKYFIPFRIPRLLLKDICWWIFGKNNLYNILNKNFSNQIIWSKKAKRDFGYIPDKGLEMYLENRRL